MSFRLRYYGILSLSKLRRPSRMRSSASLVTVGNLVTLLQSLTTRVRTPAWRETLLRKLGMDAIQSLVLLDDDTSVSLSHGFLFLGNASSSRINVYSDTFQKLS